MLWTILIGALVGFLASKISGNDAEMGWIANIIVGILGGLLGGFLASFLGVQNNTLLMQIIFGIIGSVILLAIYNAVTGRKRL